MLEKLKSRKLIVAVVGLLMILATQFLGVDEATADIAGGHMVDIIVAYVVGQGVVDAAVSVVKR